MLGDKSTAGGIVLEGEHSTTNHGTPLTYLGARVYCHACKSEGHISPRGPRRPFTMMEKDAALDGDVCLCECVPNPVMLASQNTMWESFEGFELDRMGFNTDGTPIDRIPKGDFDERVRIVDGSSRPLASVPYHIRTTRGRVFKGLTDESGYCPRVYTQDAETLDIALGMKALDRWEE